MGKQKSFIIVGSVFLGVMLLLLLIPVLTKGLKETKCYFAMDSVNIEVGKERATSPTIYASGDVKEIKLEYTLENNELATFQPGAYAAGAYSLYCWSFTEINSENELVDKDTRIPYDRDDEVSIIDGYWAINGEKTEHMAEKEYTDSEIQEHIGQTSSPVSVKCYILNGVQTDIPYSESVVPVRDEETGHWFINGEDTGYSYKGLHITLLGKKQGSTTLTFTGTIDGKEVSASMTINVINPDPTGVVSKYIEDTLIIKKGQEVDLEYEVTDNNPVAQASQVVNTSVVNGSSIQLTGTKVKGVSEGATKIKLTAPEESFTSAYYTYSANITVLVLDVDDAVLADIKTAHEAISKIGAIEDTAECRQLVATATAAVNKLNARQKELLPNYETYSTALSAMTIYDQIHVIMDKIDLGDLSNKNADFYLPKKLDENGDYKITWRSSDTSVIKVQTIKEGEYKDTHNKAVVSNVEEAKTVKLTVTIGYQGYKTTKEFTITVIPQ